MTGLATSTTDVHISIVDHENRDLVRACLLSLPAACEGISWRTTVIDNVSADGSGDMLASEFPDVAVIANARRLGFGANHNQVLRGLVADRSSRYALILNDDTELRAGAVTAMATMLDANPALGAVVPTIVDYEGRVAASRVAYPTATSALIGDWTDRTEPADPGGFLQGCCLLLRLAAIEAVGPFDERFFLFYEDTDLSRRLVDAGWSLATCEEAVVVHRGHASVFKPDLVDVTPRQGRRSRYLYFAKHQGRTRAELITALGRTLLLVRATKAWVGATLSPDHGRRQVRRRRARRLFGLARLNPRRALPAELAASASSRERARTAIPAAPPARGRNPRSRDARSGSR